MIRDASFFMPGGKAGVLLIHGLTGTPAEMHILATGLNRAGFTVSAVQLAGHCGTEEDLIKTNWRDWYQSVREEAEHMLESVEVLFVGGLSMGAVLALKLAADYPHMVSGVGVYGATFTYDGWSIPLYVRKLGFLTRWFKKVGLFRNKSFIERPPYGVKDERIRKSVAASMLSGDSSKAGLAGNPFPALAEMIDLNRIVRRLLPKITAPCLIMHSIDDDIAGFRANARFVARKVSGPVELVPLNNSYHLITIDRDRKLVIEKSVEFFADLCPPAIKAELKITAQADKIKRETEARAAAANPAASGRRNAAHKMSRIKRLKRR